MFFIESSKAGRRKSPCCQYAARARAQRQRAASVLGCYKGKWFGKRGKETKIYIQMCILWEECVEMTSQLQLFRTSLIYLLNILGIAERSEKEKIVLLHSASLHLYVSSCLLAFS